MYAILVTNDRKKEDNFYFMNKIIYDKKEMVHTLNQYGSEYNEENMGAYGMQRYFNSVSRHGDRYMVEIGHNSLHPTIKNRLKIFLRERNIDQILK